ncbi:MAG TPA: hypothetical protein VFV87_07425, partial [Pirellulaceae bacterium]|nr:hypothetical protein [Pirellulaceae bacterium]
YCLTDEARQKLQPKKLHEILAAMADKQLAAAREALSKAAPDERRTKMQENWTRLLGDTTPAKDIKVREGAPHVEEVDGITITRELLETEPGIEVPVMTIELTKFAKEKVRQPTLVVGLAADGLTGILQRQPELIAEGLSSDCIIVLPEVRGTGASHAGSGQQGGMSSYSATSLMLGQPLLAGQLRDLRAVWKHMRGKHPRISSSMAVGGSGVEPLAADAAFSYPRRIDGRPPECQPTGALLAMLLGLYADVDSVVCRHGLASYGSVLDSQFVQVPHECIVPGVFQAGDLPALAEVLKIREFSVDLPVDGRGRLAE